MIKRIFGLFALVAVVISLSGCGEVVSPGYKAKMLDSNGFSGDILDPGRHQVWMNEELVVLETSTQTISIPLNVKMADDLELSFKINFRTRVNGKDDVLNAVFRDIKPTKNEDTGYKTISLDQVFAVYGRDTLSNIARSVVSKYKVTDVSKNYDLINKQLQVQLQEAMKNNPLEVSNVTLADIGWPEIITKAIESQQERELSIKTEQNQQDIEMVKRTNALALAQADREIELTKARTLRDQNAITNDGLSDKLIAYKALEVQALMAENKNAVFVPYEAFGNTGMSNRIFNSK